VSTSYFSFKTPPQIILTSKCGGFPNGIESLGYVYKCEDNKMEFD
jgi:hypothetical protein